MSIPILTFSTSALVLTLYILHDEIQRARDKHNTSKIKRPPRYNGWIGITTTLFWASALTILLFATPTLETGAILTSTIFCLLGLLLLHRYATSYLSINPNGTITHRTWTGRRITTPINAYTYTPTETTAEGDFHPDQLKLYNSKGQIIASFSPRILKEYTIAAHLIFRHTEHRWADMNTPEDAHTIKKAAAHPLNITRSLRRFRDGNNLATETLTTPTHPKTNPGLHKNHRRGGVFKSLIVLNALG